MSSFSKRYGALDEGTSSLKSVKSSKKKRQPKSYDTFQNDLSFEDSPQKTVYSPVPAKYKKKKIDVFEMALRKRVPLRTLNFGNSIPSGRAVTNKIQGLKRKISSTKFSGPLSIVSSSSTLKGTIGKTFERVSNALETNKAGRKFKKATPRKKEKLPPLPCKDFCGSPMTLRRTRSSINTCDHSDEYTKGLLALKSNQDNVISKISDSPKFDFENFKLDCSSTFEEEQGCETPKRAKWDSKYQRFDETDAKVNGKNSSKTENKLNRGISKCTSTLRKHLPNKKKYSSLNDMQGFENSAVFANKF